MKKKTSKSLTGKQLAELRAVAALPDSAIDTSDAPEVLDWSGAKRGLFYRPIKQQLTLRLDSDVIAWFKKESAKGYQTRINQALREYLQRQRDNREVVTQQEIHGQPGDEFLSWVSAPGHKPSASDCIRLAVSIARSLEHTRLSSHHLMLALTMNPNTRRLLEPVADPTRLREFAMLSLGKLHSRFRGPTDDGSPMLTPDFVEVLHAAREAAGERSGLVSISDLINAFPTTKGRLRYGRGTYGRDTEPGQIPKIDSRTIMETERRVVAAHKQFAAVTRSLDEKLIVAWMRQSSSWL